MVKSESATTWASIELPCRDSRVLLAALLYWLSIAFSVSLVTIFSVGVGGVLTLCVFAYDHRSNRMTINKCICKIDKGRLSIGNGHTRKHYKQSNFRLPCSRLSIVVV